MPAILLSPLVKWTLATLGGAMVVHWVIKEARRINEELDSRKRVRVRITDREKRSEIVCRPGCPRAGNCFRPDARWIAQRNSNRLHG